MISDRTISLPGDLLVGEQVTLLPEALRAWRKERSMSQRDLALKASCSEGLISTIESGYRQASLTVALRIAAALGVNVRSLGLIHVDLDALSADLPEAS